MTKKYFPHNIDAVMDIDPIILELMTESWDFEDVMQAKMVDYEIPSSVFCIMRARNKDTLKVKEYTYQRQHAADKRMNALIKGKDKVEVTLITDEAYLVIRNYQDE